MESTQTRLQRLKETGKIDGSKGGQDVGFLLDFHNNNIKKLNEKHFTSDLNDRNLYYWKLLVKTMEAIRSGTKKKAVAKESKIFV